SPDTLNFPDFLFMFSKNLIIFDHFKRKIILISNVVVDEFSNLKVAFENGRENILKMKESIEKPLFLIQKEKHKEKGDFKSNFKKDDFLKSVKKVKKYIVEGEIIQAVISQRWKRRIDVEPFNLYRALRSINPSPYMFFIETGEIKLIGSSPEILVKLENKKAIVRPIAGTRKRGKDEIEEKKLEEELLNDEKERAEHIMLVDLGRNDLGRVCIPGSVKVTDLMVIEKYSHVMHIVSNVEGRLKKGKDGFDLLEATFPAGTVSGAPKIRAMEIIEEIEPEKRGVYAGGVGYFSFQNNMDFCITIRTFFIKGNEVFIQAGAGIVADSVPEKEYIETKNKAKGLMEAYKLAEEMEK
ncbi:anthranilate synthase component I family protein, partial [bacterium]|nr:anthranilate synthase component I family protein [bacterium]